MEYIVNMQGFKQSADDYVLKELAILPLEKDSEPVVLLFQEPYIWRRLTDRHKKENTWLENYYHGLPWEFGEIPYVNISKILREGLHDANKVFVRGQIRKEWFKRFKFNSRRYVRIRLFYNCTIKKNCNYLY